MFIAALFRAAKNWKQFRCFQKFRRDKKHDGITTMKLYKPLKINKPLKHIAQGIRYYVIVFM